MAGVVARGGGGRTVSGAVEPSRNSKHGTLVGLAGGCCGAVAGYYVVRVLLDRAAAPLGAGRWGVLGIQGNYYGRSTK